MTGCFYQQCSLDFIDLHIQQLRFSILPHFMIQYRQVVQAESIIGMLLTKAFSRIDLDSKDSGSAFS